MCHSSMCINFTPVRFRANVCVCVCERFVFAGAETSKLISTTMPQRVDPIWIVWLQGKPGIFAEMLIKRFKRHINVIRTLWMAVCRGNDSQTNMVAARKRQIN